MGRPQSAERVSLKTLLVMLVILRVSEVVLSCTDCVFQKSISTSQVIISEASNCRVTSSGVLQTNSEGNDLHVSELQPGTSYDLMLNCTTECCIQFTTRPDAIRNLFVTNVTTTNLSLNWIEPMGRSSFYRVDWDDNTVLMNKTNTQTSLNITGLTAGVQYVFRIVAFAADSQTEGVPVNKTQYTRPDAIRNLSVTRVTTANVSLNWTEPEGRSSFYRVEWDDNNVPMNKTTTQTSVVITGLTAGVQYVFRVVAVAADNQTAGVSVNKTQYTRPDAIRNLSVTRVTTANVSLNWTEPDGRSSFYRVEWDDNSVPMNKTTTQTSVDITGLTAGVQYVFRVVAVAADNQTAGVSVSKTQYTKPDFITNLITTQITTANVSLNWTEPEGRSSFYRVEWDDNSVPMNKTTTQTSVDITGLTAGVQYVFRVIAVAADNQTAGVSVSKTQYTRPDAIRNLSVTRVTTANVSLNWTEPDGRSSFYRVEWDDNSVPMNKTTTQTSVDITGLTAGVQYVFRVVAFAADNQTAGVSVSKTQYTRPNKVVIVLEQTGNSTLGIAWDQQGKGNVTFYEVNLANSALRIQRNESTNATKANFSELSPGRIYDITVSSVAGSFKSNSDPYHFATKPNPPQSIETSQTNDSISVTWETPLHMDGIEGISYNISYNHSQSDWVHTSVSENTVTLSPLSPGTEYLITLKTVGPQNLASTSVDLSLYTTLDSPTNVKAIGTTTNMTVTWSSSGGSSYSVEIYNSSADLIDNRTVPSIQPVLFSNLRPGQLYSVNVSALSGAFRMSETIQNATYPNPPESIEVVEQTTSSINISWGRPLDMDLGQYNFSVFISGRKLVTAHNWALEGNLSSGTQYQISVVTVGALEYQSMPVNILLTTRPHPVTQLQATEITTSSLLLSWEQPEPQDGYTYNVTVANSDGILENGKIVNNNSVRLEGLQSGRKHTFNVTTLAADGTKADPRSISLFTRPDPIGGLKAVTQNTTTVYLSWTQPQENQSGYSYRVETSGCTTATKNQSENGENAYVTDLRSGSNCTFKVYSQVGNGTEGDPVSTSQYTKPEILTPIVSPGGNDSIKVSWPNPQGTVEKYVVNLNSSDGESSTQELGPSSQAYQFLGLMAAKVYSVKLSTVSGPFTEESEPVSSATYPNQPGPIELKERTTDFIFLEWGEAPGEGPFNYSVFSQPAADITITLNTVNLSELASGTTYDISVSTKGPLGLTSLPVHIQVTTRPGSVRSLEVISTSEEEITVKWESNGFRYRVATGNYTNETNLVYYELKNLTPGTQYTVSITTLTSDGTEGIPTSVSECTDAAPVTDLSCEGPNRTDALLVLSWSRPRGANQGFEVNPNNVSLGRCDSSCSHNLTHLRYDTEYNVTVRTLSCGKKSVATQKACKTGITDPPAPNITEVSVTGEEHDRFTLPLSPTLFDETHGPIVNYGVLVTSDPQGASGEENSLLKTYLNKTYEEWTAGSTTTYLAIIKDSELSKRINENDLVVVVGDGTKYRSYNNGPLSGFKTYSFAVVAFTYLDIKEGLVSVEKSFFSISKFYPGEINLPLNPVVIGGAVGGSIAALLILIMALVISVVCWKKISKGKPSDVPIYSIRAKVSVPVTVENYEAYYRQHRADSNCGFAEQWESLKPVGVAQTKACALIPENKGKNRYNNVLPYDSTRVKLSVHGTPHDDYINANYMPGYKSRKEFVAAQGPLPTTLIEFWRMIWEKNVHTLVMLTRCNELGRVKCEQYWPSRSQNYGTITVKTTSDIPLEDWTIRDFSVKNLKTAEIRNIRQFHFTAWPDHGVPETTELLINFRHLVREHMDECSRYSPTVVHCSAGVGRTGTFIAIDRLIFQIECDGVVDVYGIVHDLRMHRPLMVQTEEQYVFLNQCALDIIRSRTGTNVDLIYQNTGALSIYENFEPMKQKNGFHNA